MEKGIWVLIIDIDGTMTDGCVYMDLAGNEMLRFSRIDGYGLELLRNKGFLLVAISREPNTGVVYKRLLKLKFQEIHLGVTDKLKIYDYIKDTYDVYDKNICVCGDDVTDIPLLQRAALSCCPANAQPGVKEVCEYRSEKTGGEHFIREICNIFSGGKHDS